jgi:hypothetical protein
MPDICREQLRAFARDGYIVVSQVVSSGLVDAANGRACSSSRRFAPSSDGAPSHPTALDATIPPQMFFVGHVPGRDYSIDRYTKDG